MNLLAELRKRNVFRVLAAYLVGSWLVMQVIGFVANAAELPDWIDSFVLIVVLLGLPIVGIAAWALELSPDGVKSTGSTDDTPVRPFGLVDGVLSAAVVIIVSLFAWQQFAGPASVQVAADERISGQSIAVLPFVAISEAPEDIILGDGLAEEMLNVLAQFPDLSVAGRTSSFSFRDQQEDIPAIGEALGVSHVLEGSVRRSGEQVRVTAQLIRVTDGFHIWSGNYDRPFSDILEVQDEIVRRIAQVLTIRLGVSSNVERGAAPATNARAYEQYLRGRVMWAERHDDANRSGAIVAFQTAVDIDPDFAGAWAALARAVLYSGPPDGYSLSEHLQRGRDAADRALGIDPNNAEAMVALAYWNMNGNRNWQAAQEWVERALAIAPNAAFTHYQAAMLYEVLGDLDHMTAALRRAMALDPLNLTIRDNAIDRYLAAGQFGEARRLAVGAQFPRLWRIREAADIAWFMRDADAFETAITEFRQFAADPANGLDAPLPSQLANSAAFVAAFRGDAATVLEKMPTIMDAAEQYEIDPMTPAYLHYFLADYETAARQFYTLVQRGEYNPADSTFVTAITEIDTGLRCQPDYHAIWEMPGMPELTEIRRANGASGNLPLSGPECDEWLGEDVAE